MDPHKCHKLKLNKPNLNRITELQFPVLLIRELKVENQSGNSRMKVLSSTKILDQDEVLKCHCILQARHTTHLHSMSKEDTEGLKRL